MVYSPYPITVDGFALDAYAFGIDSKVRTWAALRSANVAIPGVDGVAASLNDDLEPIQLALSMWVIGTNPTTGVVPSNSLDQFRDNLDALSFIFGKQHALTAFVEQVHSSGTQRRAWGKVEEAISPEVRAGVLGRFTVTATLHDGLWEDLATSDFTSTPTLVSGNFFEVTTLQGATGPINDAVILVTGPVTNPRLTDLTTSAYVQLNQALAAGQFWRLNVGTWASRYGSGLTLSSADTAGTDGHASTQYGGGNARFLRMVPTLSTGARRVQMSLTGTGITSATTVSVRARRKFKQ